MNRLTQILIVSEKQAQRQINHPIGTGPYRFIDWKKNQLRLEAFDEYWRGKPAIQSVRFSALSASMISDRFAKKNLDMYRLLPPSILQQSQHGMRIVGRPGLAVMYLWFNCSPNFEGKKNPFGDMRVRQAISMALDRNRIVEKLGKSDTPVDQVIPDGVFGFMPAWGKLTHDPDSSRRLLRQAGYATGFETTLAHPPGESYDHLTTTIAEMLAPTGIRVRSEEVPFPKLLEARGSQRLPFFVLPWTFDDGDAWTFLMASLHTKAGPSDFRSTNPGYSNPALDRMIEQSQQAATIQDISTHYEAILHIAISELPVIPLYRRYDSYGISPRVRFRPRLDGKLLAAEMQLIR